MHARWYNPTAGNFTSRDTTTNDPTPGSANANPYTYAAGDPINQTDPTGHSSKICIEIPWNYGNVVSWGQKKICFYPDNENSTSGHSGGGGPGSDSPGRGGSGSGGGSTPKPPPPPADPCAHNHHCQVPPSPNPSPTPNPSRPHPGQATCPQTPPSSSGPPPSPPRHH